jgi:hypothetical protein
VRRLSRAASDEDPLEDGGDEKKQNAEEEGWEGEDAEVDEQRLRVMKDGQDPADEAEGGEGESEDHDPLAEGSGDAEGALHGEEPITLNGAATKCSSACGSSMVGFRANHAAKNYLAVSSGFRLSLGPGRLSLDGGAKRTLHGRNGRRGATG